MQPPVTVARELHFFCAARNGRRSGQRQKENQKMTLLTVLGAMFGAAGIVAVIRRRRESRSEGPIQLGFGSKPRR